MSEKKQSYRERMEIDEIIKFEIESGNPLSEFTSYASYKAKNKMTAAEKEEYLKEKEEFLKERKKTIVLTEKQILLREHIQRVLDKRKELPF